jgi:signal recognition particle receptor subunit beta
MVVYNAATRELTAKIVYYGPGLGGKTTNLQLLHDRLEPATVGKLLNLATQTDRTIYFDLLPVELGDIKGYKIRFQLATVPGQTAFNETRRVVLKGVDGIVFVSDSQWTMLPKNLESWQNLKDNLKANGVSFEGIPIVIQYNKRDLSDILSVDAMQEALGLSSYPFVEAVASAGRGVTETFKLISKLTFVDLLRRLQGRRPEEATAALARKEQDDLQSWKDSLVRRASPESAAAAGKRPLSLVPAPEEAPFAVAEEGSLEELPEVQEPFTEAADRPTAKVPDEIFNPLDAPPVPVEIPVQPQRPAAGPGADSTKVQALEARLQVLEREARALSKTLGEKQESFAAQLQALENAAKQEQEADVWLRSVEERLEAAEKRQRTSEDDVSMALRSLSERGEKFSQQLSSLVSQIETVAAGVQEKTSQSRREGDDIRAQLQAIQASLEEKWMQGRREAEDIRTQIAPLLEAPGQRAEADERIRSEFERLRESLAEALGDLSERLRRAVRPL